MHALRIHEAAHNRLILPENWCIMEVKADERVPQWIASLLARHDCQLSRVSKYCTGVAQIRDFKVLPLALQRPLDPVGTPHTPSNLLREPPHG
jgi:hypothetical protein